MTPYRVVSLILAGGQGSRLYPLTKLRSKPAVPIGGKYRLVDVTISNCLHSGFRQIFIITQFAAESLHRHIFSTYRFDNFTKDFVTILSAQQTLENRNWYQGTADAVRQNLRFIRKYGDYVLILSGDHLYRMDYRQLVEYHIEKNADITISTIPVKEAEASQLGILQASPEGEIHAFVEKPTDPDVLHSLRTPEQAFRQFGIEAGGRAYLASMGIYVFKREVLFDLLANTTDQDFGKDVIPSAIKTHRVFAYMFDGYWEDIGTIRSFYEAHMQLVDYEPKFNFYNEERPIYTHPRFLPPVKLLDAEINNAILGDGAIVTGARINHSIIGIRSIIENGSVLNRVIMMGADFYETPEQKEANARKGIPNVGIGRNCSIENAIIDKNARIGDDVTIRKKDPGVNEGEELHSQYVIRDGIVIIPKNAIIHSGTTI